LIIVIIMMNINSSGVSGEFIEVDSVQPKSGLFRSSQKSVSRFHQYSISLVTPRTCINTYMLIVLHVFSVIKVWMNTIFCVLYRINMTFRRSVLVRY